MGANSIPRKFDSYVPRVLLTRLATAPEDLVQSLEGTMVFADVSGFTRLSERLARVGKEGAEHLVDTINACFSALLADAYAHGGSLLKFGGDALLLWFEVGWEREDANSVAETAPAAGGDLVPPVDEDAPPPLPAADADHGKTDVIPPEEP